MSLPLPELSIGNPLRKGPLSLFALFAEPRGEVDYRLSDEALAEGAVIVEEVSESGSVPDLLVDNKSDHKVLFIEGEELVGAKQNRVLNTSVLVPVHVKLKIPVSCVEQGRWAYKSRSFGSSGSHSPSELRRALKASVSESVKRRRGHRSDQGTVWKLIACLHDTHGIASGSSAMSDAFEANREKVTSFQTELPYVDGAVGLALAVGGQIVALDTFDRPDTCRKVWKRLLSGVVFDALEAGDAQASASEEDVERLIKAMRGADWERVESVGDGEEYRTSFGGDHATALVCDGVVVHASVIGTMPESQAVEVIDDGLWNQ